MAPDSIYITMLRDPVAMFESIFTYAHYDYVYGIDGFDPLKTLKVFLKNPSYYYQQEKSQEYIGHGKNPMLYDFGLENIDKDNTTRIADLISLISHKFDLVMMADYFHESMILLKDMMCWKMSDIAFFPLNSRTNVTVPSSITKSMRQKIRKWNQGDVQLYDYFNKTFWQRVEAYGVKRMKREVKLLKDYNEYLFKKCIYTISDNDTNVWHPHNVFVNTFKVKEEMKDNFLCSSMAKSELLYTAKLRTELMAKHDLITVTPGPPPPDAPIMLIKQ